ncbi:hypothetical protein [uncultured Sphingomonas sp.]|uniref:hypothetical protein n=1 Tax=uncultured Sphingomonas sp. TaxID=158754 RepID=UPI0025CB7AD0|nr:hypothetical protein [uncultured Sphingomonas sp.]
MRFLLLLSALLASLCGVISGTASATAQVEASVTVSAQADAAAADAGQRFKDVDGPRDLPRWHVAAPGRDASAFPLYLDRPRE